MREIVNAIFYVLRRRHLADAARGFPPHQTVYGWFLRLRDAGVLERSTIIWSCTTANGSDARPARPPR